MKKELLTFLVCPACQSDLEPDLKELADDGEYMSGALLCKQCSLHYPITRGVPRMTITHFEKRGPSETFGFEWKKHGQKKLEGTTVFGRTEEEDVDYFLEATQTGPKGLDSSVILDVGCGSGQLTEGLSKLAGAKTVIGVDIHSAIEYPFQRCRGLPNVHIVQADIFAMPFKTNNLDIVWSNGVIHHTSDPKKSFLSLARLVKKNGRLYIWVYEKRNSPFRLTKDFLDKLGLRKIPLNGIYLICKAITIPSFLLHSLYRLGRRALSPNPSSAEEKIKTRYRSLKEIELTWFDALSPKYVFRFTEEEIQGWFLNAGFQKLMPYLKNKIGVCGVKQG